MNNEMYSRIPYHGKKKDYKQKWIDEKTSYWYDKLDLDLLRPRMIQAVLKKAVLMVCDKMGNKGEKKNTTQMFSLDCARTILAPKITKAKNESFIPFPFFHLKHDTKIEVLLFPSLLSSPSLAVLLLLLLFTAQNFESLPLSSLFASR